MAEVDERHTKVRRTESGPAILGVQNYQADSGAIEKPDGLKTAVQQSRSEKYIGFKRKRMRKWVLGRHTPGTKRNDRSTSGCRNEDRAISSVVPPSPERSNDRKLAKAQAFVMASEKARSYWQNIFQVCGGLGLLLGGVAMIASKVFGIFVIKQLHTPLQAAGFMLSCAGLRVIQRARLSQSLVWEELRLAIGVGLLMAVIRFAIEAIFTTCALELQMSSSSACSVALCVLVHIGRWMGAKKLERLFKLRLSPQRADIRGGGQGNVAAQTALNIVMPSEVHS